MASVKNDSIIDDSVNLLFLSYPLI